MEEELIKIIQKFALTNKEIWGVDLDLSDIDSEIKECQGSWVGRIMGEKVVNFVGVKNFVTTPWEYPKELRIVELQPNCFNSTSQKRKMGT